jgi:hypothetical protein
MSNEAEVLGQSVCIMLRQRAYRGNPQSKHGMEAAYDWEVWNFTAALDDWLTRRERMKQERASRYSR